MAASGYIGLQNHECRQILAVHDEADYECRDDRVDELTVLMKRRAEGVVDWQVPLTIEAGTGRSWAEAA